MKIATSMIYYDRFGIITRGLFINRIMTGNILRKIKAREKEGGKVKQQFPGPGSHGIWFLVGVIFCEGRWCQITGGSKVVIPTL